MSAQETIIKLSNGEEYVFTLGDAPTGDKSSQVWKLIKSHEGVPVTVTERELRKRSSDEIPSRIYPNPGQVVYVGVRSSN